ncbi:ATP-binding protein [Myxococcota bacterium]|nr:ATP-binding protein [Myxococcota bacterium]MBU1379689.1 ATP-binding protein [Myxococcota bacterium]MBU1496900.1 ATP-binding protein [Myxococcota bacterium]
MIIAVASGKGGTGKTTVSINLALTSTENIILEDCDVEEPNAALFLQFPKTGSKPVSISVPSVDLSKCNGCGECSSFCRFNALITFSGRTEVLSEFCHSCNGCMLVCPEKAISMTERRIGVVNTYSSEKIELKEGVLDTGIASSPPLIRALKKTTESTELIIRDSPPGTACPVTTTIAGSDYVILVTEPTPFGIHDLKMAVEMVQTAEIPFGIIINRSTEDNVLIDDFVKSENLNVLARIPLSLKTARMYSEGIPAVNDPQMRKIFEDIWKKIPLNHEGVLEPLSE